MTGDAQPRRSRPPPDELELLLDEELLEEPPPLDDPDEELELLLEDDEGVLDALLLDAVDDALLLVLGVGPGVLELEVLLPPGTAGSGPATDVPHPANTKALPESISRNSRRARGSCRVPAAVIPVAVTVFLSCERSLISASTTAHDQPAPLERWAQSVA